jgi:hypothetical protein
MIHLFVKINFKENILIQNESYLFVLLVLNIEKILK